MVGPEILSRLYTTARKFEEIDFSSFSNNFVLKASHASAANIIVWDGADHGAMIPKGVSASQKHRWGTAIVTPQRFDRHAAASLSNWWLSQTYSKSYKEWPYTRVPPRLLVEELLIDQAGGLPNDYKFFVFHGKCRWMLVDSSRFSGHHRNFFLADWTPLPAELQYPRLGPPPQRPERLEEMIAIAEALGSETDFVRVDLYNLGDRIVFGELTNYPGGGRKRFTPSRYEVELAQWWNPPRKDKE